MKFQLRALAARIRPVKVSHLNLSEECIVIETIPTTPFKDQAPGTSGLRKRVDVFQQPHYLENFVQALLDVAGVDGATIVVGGDGRYYNDEALQIIVRMAAANGAARLVIGQGGLLSTPAASHLIRSREARCGIILSASHNPGGPHGDFGIKLNGANGGPAPTSVTDKIFERTKAIAEYRILQADALDLASLGEREIGGMIVEIVDPVSDYADLMEQLFDFGKIGAMLRSGFRMRFDAMHAVTGPYATEILEKRLGAPAGTVVRGEPLPDFGGLHPDPNPVHASALVETMFGADAPDFGAASDGDGDRNLIVAPGHIIAPSDSVAMLAANAHLAPAFAAGLAGVARSMPTSRALDRVAAKLGIACFETPTGWKYFGNLLDAGLISICGEESAGTGANHVREKDGLWAVLLWLNILAARRQPIGEILREHWQTYGRDYYQRHDYEDLPIEDAQKVMDHLRGLLPSLPGSTIGSYTVSVADEFSYEDKVDGSIARGQGLRIIFGESARLVFRLSGTGTVGATIRIYLETFESDPSRQDQDPSLVLAELAEISRSLSELSKRLGLTEPTVIA
jgi:phosphoglucomutase